MTALIPNSGTPADHGWWLSHTEAQLMRDADTDLWEIGEKR